MTAMMESNALGRLDLIIGIFFAETRRAAEGSSAFAGF
jgi:hypothetical protein